MIFKETKNSSVVNTYAPQLASYTWSKIDSLFSCILIAIIFGNILVLFVFLRRRFRGKKSIYLLVNLTVADLMVGLSNFVFNVLVKTSWTPQNVSELLMFLIYSNFFSLMNVMASILSIAAIALERCLAVFRPFQHRLAKKWHFVAVIVVIWVCTLSTALTGALGRKSYLHKNDHYNYNMAYVSLASLAIVIICVSYTSIWIKMKFFTKFRNCRTIKENNKLAKTLFIVTVVSMVTWIPRTATDFIMMFDDKVNPSQIWNTIAMFLLYSNSFVNLLVYSISMPEFKQELKSIFCRHTTRERIAEFDN